MSLIEDIRKVARAAPDADPVALATEMVLKYRRQDLIGLLAKEIAHEQRACVARIEAAAFAQLFTATTPQKGAVTDPRFASLLDHDFAFGDGKTATWRDATIADHERRIAFLESLRDGLETTIQRHRDAITTIRAAGVHTLGEITDKAA